MKKRYLVITCAVVYREICQCVAEAQTVVDVVLMPQGLHSEGQVKMPQKIQETIDEVDQTKYDAILLGYGLCNYGIKGLHATIPLVAPRAHDCITLLLGSKEAYLDYFRSNPGTFYFSSGWLERTEQPGGEQFDISGMNDEAIKESLYREYVEKYSEDTAKYMMELMGGMLKSYSRVVFIDTGTGDHDADTESAKKYAEDNDWAYEEVRGSTDLLRRLVNSEWDEQDFLVVEPGSAIEPSYEDDIIKAVEQ